MQYTRIELPDCAMQAYIPDMALDFIPPRRAIVICPGGGYAYRSEREAEPIALVFASMGFCCFVAEYRVAPAVHPAPVQDVAHAVAWVRAHAQELHIDPNAIAVMGFSAGGRESRRLLARRGADGANRPDHRADQAQCHGAVLPGDHRR